MKFKTLVTATCIGILIFFVLYKVGNKLAECPNGTSPDSTGYCL